MGPAQAPLPACSTLGIRSPILPYWLYFHTPLYRITSHSFIHI
jgi:hypothetical protein